MSIVTEMARMTEKQFEAITTLVKDLCGINLHQGKKELVKARLCKRLRKLGIRTFDEYMTYLKQDATRTELTNMLDALSTNLTSFFREPGHFEYLAKEVLRSRVAAAGRNGRRLRVWSAGCSTGEEPYSIGVVVNEEIPRLDAWDAKILATDLSTEVLDCAGRAVYTAARLKDVPAKWRSKYFTCIETRPEKLYRVNETVRKLVSFARLNLMTRWPMRGPFDVIFCRNVMIYFDKPTQEELISRFWELLVPDGILFLGHSESLTGVRHRFRYVEPTVYRKKSSHPSEDGR